MLSAGYGAKAPGIDGGTVNFAASAPPITVTGPNAPVTINYNPVSYTAPTDYATNFVLTDSTLTQHMLVYATGGDKTFDGSATTTLSGLIGNPSGVSLVAGPNSTATFDNAAVGTDKTISFTGYSLAGNNASDFTLAADCCSGSNVLTTTGTISAVTPPVIVPPVIVPPVIVPPVIVPPVIPPVVIAPVIPPVVIAPVVVTPITSNVTVPTTNQPASSEEQPPILAVSPLLTVLPSAELPTVEIYVPPVKVAVPPAAVPVPAKTIVTPQPVVYVPPVYLPKQDRN